LNINIDFYFIEEEVLSVKNAFKYHDDNHRSCQVDEEKKRLDMYLLINRKFILFE